MSKLSKVHDPATTSTTATATQAKTATQANGAKVDSNEPAVSDFSGAG
jgi:hypothetical protein